MKVTQGGVRQRAIAGNAPQRGMMLIEGLIAILIFSLGILGMVAMGTTAINAQSDARVRSEAAALAEGLASKMALDVDRKNVGAFGPSLDAYAHQPSGTNCNFSGAASTNVDVLNWVDKVRLPPSSGGVGLPGATATSQQIVVDTTSGSGNRVQITICWRAPSDTAMRQHTLVTYIN